MSALSLPLIAVAAPPADAASQAGDPTPPWLKPPDPLEVTAGPVVDPAGELGSAFVARAIALRSASLSVGSTSSLNGYTLPVTLQVQPLLLSAKARSAAGSDNLLVRDLLQSTLAAQYVPLIVRRPSGQQTGVSTSADRTGSVTYTLPLLGTASEKEYTDAIKRAGNDLRRTILHPTIEQDEAAAQQARDQIAVEAARFSLQTSAAFGWDTRPDKPDSVNAGFTASWILTPTPVLLQPVHSAWVFNASLADTWYESAGGIASFSKFSGTAGLDYQSASGPTISLVPAWDHYSAAAGYAVIVGATTGNRRDDFTVKEAVTLKFKAGNIPGKLQLAVAEKHLGTSLHDVGINVAVSLKLPGFK
jgi:hypothetical protein